MRAFPYKRLVRTLGKIAFGVFAMQLTPQRLNKSQLKARGWCFALLLSKLMHQNLRTSIVIEILFKRQCTLRWLCLWSSKQQFVSSFFKLSAVPVSVTCESPEFPLCFRQKKQPRGLGGRGKRRLT